MRRTPVLLFTIGAMLTTGGPAFADEQTVEKREAETGISVEPAYAGDIYVNFSKAVLDGEDLTRIPRDVPVTLVIDVYNSSEDPATDIALVFDNRGDEIRWPNRNATIDRLDGFANTQVEVEILIPASAECIDDDAATGTITSSLGETQTKLWLPVACPGPRLYQSRIEWRGGDGDQLPEPGERLELWVTYGNWGVDPATNLRGTLTIDAEGVRVVTGTAAWPTVPPTTSEEPGEATQLTPFIIEIADDAPTTESGCGYIGPPETIDGEPPSDGGGSDGSTGSGGSAGTDDGTVPAEETEPMPAEDQPTDPDGTVSSEDSVVYPDGSGDEPAPDGRYAEPQPSEPIVSFEGSIHLVSDEMEMDDFIGSYPMCALAEGTGDYAKGGATGGGDDSLTGAPEAGDVDLAAAAGEDTGSTSTGTAALFAAFLAGIASAAWFVMRRKLLTR
jgi:hypothetical protein